MVNKFLFLVFFCAIFAVHSEDYVGGSTVMSIKCDEAPEFSYSIYFPKKYDHKRAEGWPVLFMFSSSGGNKNHFKQMLQAAELLDCLLVLSMETSNKYTKNEEAINATMKDFRKKFKWHDQFVFSTGVSGGSRRAALLAGTYENGKVFTGCFMSAAGANSTPKMKKGYYFAAFGTTDYNREEIVSTIHNGLLKNGTYAFEKGGHMWATEPLYTLGMSYLYANNLNEMKSNEAQYNMYFADFCKELRELADKEADVYRKYELLSVLTIVEKNKNLAADKKELQTVMQKPEIKKYIACKADLDKFLNKHFNSVASKPGEVNAKAKADMEKLAEKYKDVPYSELMKQLVEPAPGP